MLARTGGRGRPRGTQCRFYSSLPDSLRRNDVAGPVDGPALVLPLRLGQLDLDFAERLVGRSAARRVADDVLSAEVADNLLGGLAQPFDALGEKDAPAGLRRKALQNGLGLVPLTLAPDDSPPVIQVGDEADAVDLDVALAEQRQELLQLVGAFAVFAVADEDEGVSSGLAVRGGL